MVKDSFVLPINNLQQVCKVFSSLYRLCYIEQPNVCDNVIKGGVTVPSHQGWLA